MLPFITPQGASSTTFKAPPADGSLTLVEIFEYNAINSPNHPIFRYVNPVDEKLREIIWVDAVSGIRKVAQWVQTAVCNGEANTDGPLVIAILAAIDGLNYTALLMGIMRAGHIPFPISLKNSPAAVANLITKTNCKYWFVSGDTTTQKLIEASRGLLNGHQINELKPPRFSDLLSEPAEDVPPPVRPTDLDQPCIIHHSSGSTSLPKPIIVTQRMVLPYGYIPYFGEIDCCGEILSAHGLPMFHLMGFFTIPWTAMIGMTAAFFPPSEIPTISSPESAMAGIISCGCTIMLTVPAFLETWAKDPRSVKVLQKFSAVQVAGGSLNSEAGDYLVANGVNIVVGFGMTEVGGAGRVVLKKVRQEGWIWVEASPHVDVAFLPLPDDPKLFRLVFKKCATHIPAIINTNVDGVEAFDTNDLVERHPTNPTLWKIYGRNDDQITHSSGEKTNPAPIEAILETDPRIDKAIMFGRSKFQAGVLIMPASAYLFDPRDPKKLAEFRSQIWSTVSLANESAPRHSRLFKEMIIIANSGKPFELTAKGSIRRQANLKAYDEEIEAAYTAVNEISHPEIALPKSWSLEHVRGLIRIIVRGVVSLTLKDNDDIFMNGGDSLSATSIRSSIQRALQESKQIPVSRIRALPQNFVFEFPTISALSALVYGGILMSSDHPDEGPPNYGTEEFFDWGSLSSTSTIIKLRKGNGEPPLIILHGVGGSALHFKSFQEKFTSALWAIQITPETPLATIQEQAAFYYRKIKEEQPHGPYRLASFSASGFLLVHLTLLLEADGEKVVQMAMLDYFPLAFVPLISGIDRLCLNNPENERVFIERGFDVIHAQLLQEDGGLFPNKEESAQQLYSMVRTGVGSPATKIRWDRMKATLLQTYHFVTSLSVTPPTVDEARALLIAWMRNVKAPVSVFVAANGTIDCIPEEIREKWRDLGARECYPNAETIVVNGGHFQLLVDDRVVKVLQNGYI